MAFLSGGFSMCGIGGIFNFSGQEVLENELRKMNALMVHRGPDDEGIFKGGPLGLCHRRLKIIDLSDNGHQPIVDSSGRFVMTYNGECYNYKELKSQLEKDGVLFRSESDTEVVLASLSVGE